MKIEFFDKDTGVVLDRDNLFVLESCVYEFSYHSVESSPSVVDFWTFVEECPKLGWRVVPL